MFKICLNFPFQLFCALYRYTERTEVRPNEIWDEPLEEISKTSEALIPIDMEPVDGDFRSLCNKELHGRISHVVSPSKIFVQLLSSESTLKRY